MADKKPARAGLFDELDALWYESLNTAILKLYNSDRVIPRTVFELFIITTPAMENAFERVGYLFPV
ncbi:MULTISPECIES: hypothetical protein [Enterobacteriaceae]|uniref:hypothetical protein n=1 Tax=Enterobacteriaceae TaxID=543 RepID=UPI002003CDF3|nr:MULTISPECIES: hypothetical protein [Enterobacteriaceae]HCM9493855.1 hypothetical protein [Enterobacter hormaechei subsp. hormaechei]MCK7317214.1 hypothetical protein [Enterobacter cloacae]WJS52086.1 hypothetical protein QU521_05475 [Enterobacter roggenkampii]WOI93134.1 hypothetical protein R1016_15765 [Citrobacter koseri]HCC5759620.1 hypothetical protein [Citrobacter koseri]